MGGVMPVERRGVKGFELFPWNSPRVERPGWVRLELAVGFLFLILIFFLISPATTGEIKSKIKITIMIKKPAD